MLAAQVDARLAPLQADLTTKTKELDAQFETLASIRGGDATAMAEAEKRAEKLAGERAILEARLRSVATQNGIDADELLKDLSSTPAPEPKKVTPPDFDPSALSRSVNVMGLTAFENAALMEDLADEHQQLFGKPMSRVELIAALKDEAKRTQNPNLGLRDVFNKKFNVEGRREEIRESDVQKRIQTALEADRTARADEAALRSTNQPAEVFTPGSPVFAAVSKDAKPAAVGGIPDGVVASMKAWVARKQEKAS